MCGIAGLYDPTGLDPEPTRGRLIRAAEVLAHRGPDASGVLLWPQDGIGMAHRRLSILDLDSRADQPMVSSDGTVAAVYNGEIYNFLELRVDLQRAGRTFRTASDTEVLIEGYRVWGLEGLLARAAGMFAFALYDRTLRRLVMARDRSGKKPLFFAEAGRGLAFASELRGLFSLGVSRELDPEGFDAYLALQFVPPPRTLLRGVRQVPPAHWLEVSPGQAPRLRRYWHPFTGRSRPRRPSEALDRIEEAFLGAVRRRLVSDVPVCLFLSGGVDSGLTAAFLQKAGAGETRAYTLGYEDMPGHNEFAFARLTAAGRPLRHEELRLSSRHAREILVAGGAALDEPISDWVWVPLHHLAARARADGFKVALVGEGSDELFFGYDVMMDGLWDLRRFERPGWKLAARALSTVFSPVFRHARRGHRRFDLWRRAAAGEPVYMGSSVGWGKSQRRQVAGPALLCGGDPDAGRRFIDGLYREYGELAPDADDAVNLICWVEFQSKMSNVLLPRLDRVTMLHSVEARSPFLDHDLVELAFSIPGDWKIRGGSLKRLLRDMARRHLPKRVVDHRKRGFSFPFKEWLRGDLGAIVERDLRASRLVRDGWLNGDFAWGLLRQHRRGRVDHAPRLWALWDLARWHARWIEGSPPAI